MGGGDAEGENDVRTGNNLVAKAENDGRKGRRERKSGVGAGSDVAMRRGRW